MAGMAIGLGLFLALNAGYFQPWQQIPTSTLVPQKLMYGWQENVLVQTSSNEEYICFPYQPFCKNIQESGYFPTYNASRVCDKFSPKFSVFVNHPKNIVDCLETQTPLAEATGRAAFALDSDHNLWVWVKINNAFEEIIGICLFAFIGLVFGLFIAAKIVKHYSKTVLKYLHNKMRSMKSTSILSLPRFNNERCSRANFSDKGAVIERFRSIIGL